MTLRMTDKSGRLDSALRGVKALWKNIWEAPGSTALGAVIASLTAMGTTWADAPPAVTIISAVVIAFLGGFVGPNKPGNQKL